MNAHRKRILSENRWLSAAPWDAINPPRGWIDTGIFYTPGSRCGTLRKTVIEYGTRSTPATSLWSNFPKELTIQGTPKNSFTMLEKASHTRQLPPGTSMRRRYVDSKSAKCRFWTWGIAPWRQPIYHCPTWGIRRWCTMCPVPSINEPVPDEALVGAYGDGSIRVGAQCRISWLALLWSFCSCRCWIEGNVVETMIPWYCLLSWLLFALCRRITTWK